MRHTRETGMEVGKTLQSSQKIVLHCCSGALGRPSPVVSLVERTQARSRCHRQARQRSCLLSYPWLCYVWELVCSCDCESDKNMTLMLRCFKTRQLDFVHPRCRHFVESRKLAPSRVIVSPAIETNHLPYQPLLTIRCRLFC